MPLRFTLHYRGNLKSGNSARPIDKHKLRVHFHRQLVQLWNGPRLRHRGRGEDPDIIRATEEAGLPCKVLVSKAACRTAELDVLMLRRGAAGMILQNADIDNRLKTLFDALRIPTAQELPKDDPFATGEETRPCCCLLEDDALISRVTVEVLELLEPGPEDEVILIIRATILPHSGTVDNINFM